MKVSHQMGLDTFHAENGALSREKKNLILTSIIKHLKKTAGQTDEQMN